MPAGGGPILSILAGTPEQRHGDSFRDDVSERRRARTRIMTRFPAGGLDVIVVRVA